MCSDKTVMLFIYYNNIVQYSFFFFSLFWVFVPYASYLEDCAPHFTLTQGWTIYGAHCKNT